MLRFTGYVNCSKHPIDTVTAISYNNNRKQITKKDRGMVCCQGTTGHAFLKGRFFIYHVQ